MYVRYTVLVLKENKDIIKVVHVTSVGYLDVLKHQKYTFVQK